MTNEVAAVRTEIEAKNFDVTRRLLRKAGELGLMAVDVPEAYGGLEMDKVTSAHRRRVDEQAGQFLGGVQRARRHRHAAHRLVRHRRAEAEIPAQARHRRVDRRLRAVRIVVRLRRA